MKVTREQQEQLTIDFRPEEREKAWALVKPDEGWHVVQAGPHSEGKHKIIARRTVKSSK